MNTRFALLCCVWLSMVLPAAAQSPVYLASASTFQPPTAFQFAVPQPESRVHVLLVGDTNDPKIGHSAGVDLDNLAGLFRQLLPESRLQMQILRGDEVNKASILQRINAVRPTADDAFVFIWTGHGAYNNGGHYFSLPNGDGLYRRDVLTAMRLFGPRLVVLLSGSCNEISYAPVQRVYRPYVCIYPTVHHEPARISPIAEELFLKSRGVVDVNGASEGQLGFANYERGCSFLYPLANYVRENSETESVLADACQ